MKMKSISRLEHAHNSWTDFQCESMVVSLSFKIMNVKRIK
jgi:hypothetical protein